MLCFAAGNVHAQDLDREFSEMIKDGASQEDLIKMMQNIAGQDETIKKAMEMSRKFMAEQALSNTPLTTAARNGDVAEVERLIKEGADLNAVDGTFDFTPLMHAAQHNRADIAKLLINAGAKVNQKNKNDVSALFVACSSNAPDVAKLLVAAGADMNYVQKGDGYTPLSLACRDVCFETAKVLVDAGADVNKRISSVIRKDAKTALMEAAGSGSPKVVKLLIDAGAEVNARDADGNTPLLYWGGNFFVDSAVEVGRMLIAAGANVNAKNKYGTVVLMQAARAGLSTLMKMLIAAGADVNAKNNDGDTALIYASGRRGDPPSTGVKMLIDAGANVNAKNNNGWTALHLAARDNAVSIARTLMKAGANVNAQDKEGETAIMVAGSSIDSGPEVVMEIIAGGANLNLKSNSDWTALEYARIYGRGDIAEVIERALKRK